LYEGASMVDDSSFVVWCLKACKQFIKLYGSSIEPLDQPLLYTEIVVITTHVQSQTTAKYMIPDCTRSIYLIQQL